MSSAYAVPNKASSKKSLSLVAILLLSTLGGIIFTPTASATVSGDYEITSTIYPMDNLTMSSWDPITFQVQVTNSGFFYNTQARPIEWFTCEGIQDENSCFNDREEYGLGSIDPLQVGAHTNYTFSSTFAPDGDEGTFTLVYRFIDSDTNPSNDVGIYTFHVVQSFVDVIFEPQDPILQLTEIAEYEGDVILNTDTDYVMEISGVVNSCGICGLEADIGWILVDEQGNEKANSSITYSNLPDWGTVAFTREMPALNYDEEGVYELKFGIISSIGTPSGDMNSFNDIQSVEVIFDDTVDMQITSMFPSNVPTSADYFYGENSVTVTVSNLGNHTVVQPLVRFTVMDLDEQIDSEEDCIPDEVKPGESHQCLFNLTYLGDKKLKVFVSEALNEGLDAKPADNVLNVQAEVVAGDIGPFIQQSSFGGTYNTADNITLTAYTAPTAAAPLNYTWWQEGIRPLGSGGILTIPASYIGLGDHYISVRATDATGALESAVSQITIFNSTDISTGDWLTGSAVTRTHARGIAYYDYPVAGMSYGPGPGLEALVRMSVDVVSTTEEPTAGMDWMEFDIKLSEIIPDNVPRESISIRQMVDYDQADWSPLDTDDYFELIDNDTLRVNITENMDLLLTGQLPAPEIQLSNPEISLLPDGKMRLDWNATGDTANPYFGGWKIYRVTSQADGSTYFPDPLETSSQFVWNGLMQGALSATLEGTENSWVDERELETGVCSSYALMPTDRTGNPDFLNAKVTLNNGLPGLTCGDAIDPNAEVGSISSSVSFNNDTACWQMYEDWNKCYHVTLNWNWPDNEPSGEIYWNLYRIEHKPEDVDLRYIEPIASNIRNVPGGQGTFTQNGTDYDGISPYRTYYYILTPVDTVGNELTTVQADSNNFVRVYIRDQYWDYNQHVIPEPPPPEEPPYGVEWLGDLEDYMIIENFQIAGMLMLLTIIINFVGLPIILKKRKKLKRVLARRAGNQPADLDEDFEDFFR